MRDTLLTLLTFVFVAAVFCASFASMQPPPVHLVLLSGQSNMVRLDERAFFVPHVRRAWGAERVVVVKVAAGAQPISRWVPYGDLYYDLLRAASLQLRGREVLDVTLVWMQGESDTYGDRGNLYADRLSQLKQQMRRAYPHTPVHLVAGRLSDHDDSPSWQAVRKAQQERADAWVDTDDLNGPDDALHYTDAGYRELGRRFAAAAISLNSEE